MVQVSTNTEWLLQGFRYELESTVRPQTVEYYCGEVGRFLRWAKTAGVPADIRLITKHDIQAFFHHLALTRSGNSLKSEPGQIERVRWPYYRALCRFFAWAVREGYLEQSPMDGIRLKAPKDLPVEPYRPEYIDRMLKVLDHDWQVARTPRQKILAARDRAILLLFLESGLRLEEMANLRLEDIDLERQRVLVWQGKLGKSRLSGFGPQTRKALWRYLSLRPPENSASAMLR